MQINFRTGAQGKTAVLNGHSEIGMITNNPKTGRKTLRLGSLHAADKTEADVTYIYHNHAALKRKIESMTV